MAQTLLLLDAGLFAQAVADQLGLNVRTVRTTHIRWRQTAFASLPDKPRSGAPQKLDSGHVAKDEPLTAAALAGAPLGQWWPQRARQHLSGQAQSLGFGVEVPAPFFKKAAAKTPCAKQP